MGTNGLASPIALLATAASVSLVPLDYRLPAHQFDSILTSLGHPRIAPPVSSLVPGVLEDEGAMKLRLGRWRRG